MTANNNGTISGFDCWFKGRAMPPINSCSLESMAATGMLFGGQLNRTGAPFAPTDNHNSLALLTKALEHLLNADKHRKRGGSHTPAQDEPEVAATQRFCDVDLRECWIEDVGRRHYLPLLAKDFTTFDLAAIAPAATCSPQASFSSSQRTSRRA